VAEGGPGSGGRMNHRSLWILILAMTVWSLDSDHWMGVAWADVVTTSTYTTTTTAANGVAFTQTHYSFTTATTTDNGGGGTSTGTTTATNCYTGGAQYGGGQWNLCNRTDPTQQKNTQDDNKNNNNNGADQSSMLGMAAIAAGMAMVAAGMALLPNPPTTPIGVALIAAGMALIAAGMAALAAASQMNKNADKSGVNGQNLDNLNPYASTISAPSGTDAGTNTSSLGAPAANSLGNGTGTGIKIDPALTRAGKLDTIFSDMEKKTGLNRDDMLNQIGSGANPLDVLSNSPALAGKPSSSSANLQKMMDDTLAKGVPNGQEVMDKLGLTSADLPGGSGGGASANRDLASANIDNLFPGAPDKVTPSGGDTSNMKLSSEVQAALDKNGITGRTIFEMVHTQYIKKTPLMFGVQKLKDGTAPNPYTNLNGEKVDI
jgi:hypothetical protein